MSATLTAGNDSFETEVLEAEQPVLAYFWATWCQSCKLMAPQMESLAAENADKFKVVKIEIGQNSELADRYNIMSTPTLLLFKPGQATPKEVQVGFAAKAWVAEVLQNYL